MSLLSGKCHFKIANQRVVILRGSEIECCGISKTISFKKCRYVCISSINFLGRVENACRVSFILETPKLHGLGLSFSSLDILGGFCGFGFGVFFGVCWFFGVGFFCLFFVCLLLGFCLVFCLFDWWGFCCCFFGLFVFWFFFSLVNSCWRNCFCRNNKREMCNLRNGGFSGNRTGLTTAHNNWGRGQCTAEGKIRSSTLLFPSKATAETAVRKELRQQEMDVCSFRVLSFKWLCHWRADFPARSHHKPCILGCLSLLAGPREADVSGHAWDVGRTNFILVHPIPYRESAGLSPLVGFPC